MGPGVRAMSERVSGGCLNREGHMAAKGEQQRQSAAPWGDEGAAAAPRR